MTDEFKKKLLNYRIDQKIIMIYDLKKLKENIVNLQYLKEKYNVQFLFPVKSFPNEKVLGVFSQFNFGYDITNYNEYKLIKPIISSDTIIFINGYDTSSKTIPGKVFNTCQSLSQTDKRFNSIRINTNSISNKNFSRFGVDTSNLTKIDTSRFISLNIHYFSEDKFNERKKIIRLIKKSLCNLKNIRYIDLGGNWNINDLNWFEETIKYFRKHISNDIQLIFEIGEYWFNDCGYLISKVLDINYIGNKKIITILGSKECDAKWSQLNLIYPKCENYGNVSNVFVGNTCFEKDVLYFTRKNVNLDIGDQIIFGGLNGYSYSWITSFNGLLLPEVEFYE